jgi:putative transposase
MKRIKHSESEIVSILRKQEQGMKVSEICREHGISEPTFYNWKSRYGGMEANELKRLKDLEQENARLKKMFADLSLQHEALKDVLGKKF